MENFWIPRNLKVSEGKNCMKILHSKITRERVNTNYYVSLFVTSIHYKSLHICHVDSIPIVIFIWNIFYTFSDIRDTEIDRRIASRRERGGKKGKGRRRNFDRILVHKWLSGTKYIGSTKIESVRTYHGTFISSVYRDIRVVIGIVDHRLPPSQLPAFFPDFPSLESDH